MPKYDNVGEKHQNLFIMKKFLFFLFFLATLNNFGYAQTSCTTCNTLKTNPDFPPNPPTKNNYFLLFRDEFNELNYETWGIGDLNNDRPCMENIVRNPSHVSVSGGDVILDFDQTAYQNCAYSSGGIMGQGSVDYTKNGETNPYRGWWLYPDSYLEIRSTIFGQHCTVPFENIFTYGNTGSSGWLFASYLPGISEVDLWEVVGDKDRMIQNNYHWGKGCYSCGFHEECGGKLYIRDLNGHTFDWTTKYFIFGFEWTNNVFNYYVNNVLVRSINLSQQPIKDNWFSKRRRPFTPPLPMNIRLETHDGLNKQFFKDQYLVNGTNLKADYIRVFKKNGTDPIPLVWKPQQLCSSGGGTSISVAYYPGVVYEYSSPYFDFGSYDNSYADKKIVSTCYCEARWINIKNQYIDNLAPGNYPVTVKATFPDGTIYTKIVQVTIVDNAYNNYPIFIELFETLGSHKVGAYKTFQQDQIEWSVNGGPWILGSDNGNYSFATQIILGGETYTICARKKTGCGLGTSQCLTITVPRTKGGLEEKKLSDPPHFVGVVSSGERGFYKLGVEKDPYSVSYLWSLDSLNWTSIENEPSTNGNSVGSVSQNFYGNFINGLAPFEIYVKAKDNYVESEIYKQWINIPDDSSDYVYLQALYFGNNNNQIASNSNNDPEIYQNQPLLASDNPIISDISVYNMAGVKVFETKDYSLDKNWNANLSLTTGMYFVTLRDKDTNQNKVYKLFVTLEK